MQTFLEASCTLSSAALQLTPSRANTSTWSFPRLMQKRQLKQKTYPWDQTAEGQKSETCILKTPENRSRTQSCSVPLSLLH